jgi:hypothetical protein
MVCYIPVFAKVYMVIVKAAFKNLFDILPKIYLPSQISGRISGIRPLPDIRQKQYPVHPYTILLRGTVVTSHMFNATEVQLGKWCYHIKCLL